MTRIWAGRLCGAAVVLTIILAIVLSAAPAFAAAGFDPVAATDAYLRSVPDAARQKSDAYFEGGYWLILWNASWGIAVSVLLLFSGLSARLRDAAFRVTRRRFPAIALYAVLYTVLAAVLTLPLDIYRDFIREHQYGLSNQTFGAWCSDDLIGLAVSLVFSAILVPVIYAAIHRSPRLWWLWGTGITMAFFIMATAISPVFLEPLLNHFQPLQQGPVREQILAMARSDGVPAHDVLEYDNSRQTNRISAHVSGFLGTTQISLNDNLVKQCTPDEILAVLGHEMGHYVMNHVFNFLLQVGIIVAGGFALVRWLFVGLLARYGAGWRVLGIDDPAGLPLFVAVFTAYVFILTPVLNTLIRGQEMQADIFGLNLARRPDAFANVALKLSTYRKLSPGRWEEAIFYDHPSGRTRIMTAMRWKAEQMPAPPR